MNSKNHKNQSTTKANIIKKIFKNIEIEKRKKMNKIDPITYINQLFTQLLLNITTKEAATIFCVKHSENDNQCVQMYCDYLMENYGIEESEISHVDDMIRSKDYHSMASENQQLLTSFLHHSEHETKTKILSTLNEYPEEIQTSIKSECKVEYLNKLYDQQHWRTNNIQQAMMIMKKEVIKLQMKLRFTDLEPIDEINVIEQETPELHEDNCFFVFQTVKSEVNQKRENQLRDSLQPVEMYDFWDGYEKGYIPKLIIFIIDGAVETLADDLVLIQNIFPHAKIHLIYCYKKNGCMRSYSK